MLSRLTATAQLYSIKPINSMHECNGVKYTPSDKQMPGINNKPRMFAAPNFAWNIG